MENRKKLELLTSQLLWFQCHGQIDFHYKTERADFYHFELILTQHGIAYTVDNNAISWTVRLVVG